MPNPTIVLVHGAWVDGSSWNAVSTELEGQGFTVLTPPNLLHGVTGDAAYLVSFVAQRTTGPVVLVGHSYGGVVSTNAGTQGGDVKALVYVDAFIPESVRTSSRSLADRAPPSTFPIRRPCWTSSVTPELQRETPRRSSSHRPSTMPSPRTSPSRTGWPIVASQRPITLSANTAATNTAAWKTLPSWAVVGTEHRVIPPPPSGAWRRGPARRSPKSQHPTYRWCPILPPPSTPSLAAVAALP